MGNMMAVVAALETKALIKAVTSIKPATKFRGRDPTARSTSKDSRSPNFHREIAAESRKPARNRRIVGSI
jgi:hypothetical protein